jgi:hypothetical protein
MALVFAVRSDDANFYARYSTAGKSGVPLTSQVVRVVDAGAIGGYNYDFTSTAGGAKNGLYFRGANFNYNAAGFSLSLRFKPNYTGVPAANRSLIGVGSVAGTSSGPSFYIHHASTSGNLIVTSRNAASTSVLNSVSFGAWSPTSGTWYDLVLTWDYSVTAGAVKCYIDAASFGTQTAAGAFLPSGTFPTDGFMVISLGTSIQATAVYSFGECVIWNEVIDPTANVALESGLGLLNGTSRTSFVSDVAGATLTAFDGLNSTNPGIANVKSGTGYIINGTSLTGTLETTTVQTSRATGSARSKRLHGIIQ